MAPRRGQERYSLLAATLALLVLLPTQATHATTITVVNMDGAGEGFNDPAARAPVGGNPGVTLGQLRLNAFQEAADRWAAVVDSSVVIRTQGKFDLLYCDFFSAILGSAGPKTVHADFPGAPVASTWFVQATANSIAGFDLSGQDDISATFNSDIDNGCLSGVSGWYYGFDGNPGAGQIDFIPTLLHELAHGLGFLSLVDLASGAKFAGWNDTYMLNLENHSTGVLYPAMSDAQRVAASINTGNLHWVGANVRAASGLLSAGKTGDHVHMYAPNPNEPGSSVSHFDTSLTPDELMEPFATVTNIQDPTEALLEDIGWSLVPSGPTPTPTPTVTPTPGPTCTPQPTLTGPTPTPVNLTAALKCQSTIDKETSKFVKAKTKALQKCNDSLVKDTLGPDPGPGGGNRLAFCLAEPTTLAKIAKAQSKLAAKIANACGGDDKVCDGGPGEEATAALGFYASCPNFEGSADPRCSATISDCGDIADCLECIGEAAVDQGIELFYDALIDTDPVLEKDLNKCQQTIGKETTKFLLAKEKALAKCWDGRLKGVHGNPCPLPGDGVAGPAIVKAESKKIAKICKACGGADKQCDDTVTGPNGTVIIGSGGDDDLTPVAIGFPASCDAVKIPGGGPVCIGDGSVDTLAELVECVDCVSEFKVDCIDAARAPEFQAYPCECR